MSGPEAYQELADEGVLFARRHPADTPRGRDPGGVAPPSDTFAIVGAGPDGPAAVPTGRMCAPARIVLADLHDRRPERSRELGADATFDNGAREQALAGG
jgi:threonine dehydrogenase-like Zn-dependent dehydrogenase